MLTVMLPDRAGTHSPGKSKAGVCTGPSEPVHAPQGWPLLRPTQSLSGAQTYKSCSRRAYLQFPFHLVGKWAIINSAAACLSLTGHHQVGAISTSLGFQNNYAWFCHIKMSFICNSQASCTCNTTLHSTPVPIIWISSLWKGFALHIFHPVRNDYLGCQLNKSIDFKIALLTYKVLHGLCPASLNFFLCSWMYSQIRWRKSVTCPKFCWQVLGSNSFSWEESCPSGKAGDNS